MNLSKHSFSSRACLITALILLFIGISSQSVHARIYTGGRLWDESLLIKAYPSKNYYEGHSYTLQDESNYEMGDSGLMYDPTRAAKEGYVLTSWSGAYRLTQIRNQVNDNIISMKVVYDEPCFDTVVLSSKWLKGGEPGSVYTASLCLDIKACPALDSAAFSTAARAYQRQELDLSIAQNPNYPIDLSKLSVTIKDSKGNIVPYCRALTATPDENGEFVNCVLEFVTKNSGEEEFTYNIYAIDSRGNELITSRSFVVKKDQAPQASIDMKLSYYRNGEGPAEITASFNGNKSDDPVSISWTVPGGVYTDESSGENKKISFSLDNVGKYSISVTATDIWQDTLDEFTKDDERKSASYSLNFYVQNKAPYLLGSTAQKTFELLLINSDAEGAEKLKSDMLEAGVELSVIPVTIDKSESAGELSKIGEISLTGQRSAVDQSSFWEQAHNIDDKYFFKLVPKNVGTKTFWSTLYIYRYDLANLSAEPDIFPLAADVFYKASEASTGLVTSDLQDKYLIVSVDNVSIIMDKESGEILTKVALELGNTNIACGDYLYSLCKDGIYKITISTGQYVLQEACTCFQNEGGSARLIYGRVYFPVKIDSTVYACCLNPESGDIDTVSLYTSLGTDHLTAISPVGNMYFESQSKTSAEMKAFTRTGAVLNQTLTISRTSAFRYSPYLETPIAFPIYDCYGEVNYIAVAASSSNLGTGTKLNLYHLNSGVLTIKTTSYSTTHNADFTRCIFGMQLSDGTLLTGLGTNYYTKKASYNNLILTMNPSSAAVVEESIYDTHIEYQTHKNEYYVLSYTYAGTFKAYIYKFSEGFDAKSNRLALELLSGDKDYKDRTESTNAQDLIDNNNITTEDSGPVVRYYKKGDVVKLSDFGFSSSKYDDYEKDFPLKECSSMSFPYTCTTTGRFSFTFWVVDNTGNPSFDKKSKAQQGIFFVDSDENDYEDGLGEIENPEDEARGRNIVLHRRY